MIHLIRIIKGYNAHGALNNNPANQARDTSTFILLVIFQEIEKFFADKKKFNNRIKKLHHKLNSL